MKTKKKKNEVYIGDVSPVKPFDYEAFRYHTLCARSTIYPKMSYDVLVKTLELLRPKE